VNLNVRPQNRRLLQNLLLQLHVWLQRSTLLLSPTLFAPLLRPTLFVPLFVSTTLDPFVEIPEPVGPVPLPVATLLFVVTPLFAPTHLLVAAPLSLPVATLGPPPQVVVTPEPTHLLVVAPTLPLAVTLLIVTPDQILLLVATLGPPPQLLEVEVTEPTYLLVVARALPLAVTLLLIVTPETRQRETRTPLLASTQVIAVALDQTLLLEADRTPKTSGPL